ncbi:ShET2/EspL2 family type III secretion system effector toxin [Methylibium rhizosphaerae]|uniref:ShET2/EspL2 family type III secretion system effector toxin n=1 Tax=Methylibium rhizosphaerae TaxID=2570323 RepID=UPI0015E2CFBE|nr:ShET2/EspL2 family type III secretion system effector toxin [Methylibium rhizosphaerae]
MAPRSGLPASECRPSDAADGGAASLTRLKQVPYYSSKPGRDPAVNLNQRVYFPGHEGNDEELVECRHLAVAWLLQHEVGSGKPDYRAFASEGAIARNVPRSVQGIYDTLAAAQTDLYLLEGRDWGSFAAERFREMEHNGVDAMRMLVEASMHSMAAEFKIKREPGRPPQYVQTVYDPNATVTHKRAATDDLRNVQEGSIKTFLKDEDLFLAYFGGLSTLFLVRAIPEGGLTGLPEAPPGGPVDRRTANELPPLNEMLMYYLLADGFGGSLRDVKPTILQMAKDSQESAGALLLACNVDEDSGLYAAVSQRMADATSAFCDIVRDCALSAELKLDLLSGQDATGVPALFIGMQQGCTEAVRALINGIIDSDLDMRQRAKLLVATAPNGVPALSIAMEKGRHGPVSALVDGLERSDLPSLPVAALLHGRDPDGMPALSVGMQEGHAEAVRTLAQGIASSTKLAAAHKHQLLAARDPLGRPALSVGVLSEQPRSIAALVDVVAGSDLPQGAKRDLLLARDANGASALAAAVHSDRGESVRAYAEAVLSSQLPASAKVELLLAEQQGMTAYRSALARGSDSAAAALREAVSHSSLSPEEQARVLDDAPRRRRVG